MDIGAAVRRTRKSIDLTQAEVAAKAGVGRQAIVLLEQGSGTMSTLAKVSPTIGLRIIGIAKGDVLHEQVRRARLNRRMTQSVLACRAGISLPTLSSISIAFKAKKTKGEASRIGFKWTVNEL